MPTSWRRLRSRSTDTTHISRVIDKGWASLTNIFVLQKKHFMDYDRFRTRMKGKFIKEYTKTSFSEEYQKAERAYRSLRNKLQGFEEEALLLTKESEINSLYSTIASGIYSKIEVLREKIKKEKARGQKEPADVFKVLGERLGSIGEDCSEEIRNDVLEVSEAMADVSKAKGRMKSGLADSLDSLKELHEEAREIDAMRYALMSLRVKIEEEKRFSEVERMQKDFERGCKDILQRMRRYLGAKQLQETVKKLSQILQEYFGTAFDTFTRDEKRGEGAPR
jgi:hypothetical protein